jgi:hypothetical protein
VWVPSSNTCCDVVTSLERGELRLRGGQSEAVGEPCVAYLRNDLARGACRLFITAALMAGVVIGVFGWRVGSVLIWTLVGAGVWGSFDYLWDVKRRLPTGRLPDAPESVVVQSLSDSGLLRRAGHVLMWVAACIGLAWLADRWDMGALFVPGQVVGYACASALGALMVARWEREEGRRVVYDLSTEDGSPSPYANRGA